MTQPSQTKSHDLKIEKHFIYNSKLFLHDGALEGSRITCWECETVKLSYCTWKLRATVSSTQAPQQIPKPQRRSSRRPEASTMKTWSNKFPFNHYSFLVIWSNNRLKPSAPLLKCFTLSNFSWGYLLQLWSWRHSLHLFPQSHTGCHSAWLLQMHICCLHSNKSGREEYSMVNWRN